MRLVADDDRVGVRDPGCIAYEPLVGLDGDGAVGGVLAVEQRGADPFRIAAVAELAVELVDEVPAMGEDQYAAGPRGLDEPERRHRLARSGGVLEPESPGSVWVLGLLVELDVAIDFLLVLPVLRLLVWLLFLFRLVLVLELLVFELLVFILLAGDRRRCEHRRLGGKHRSAPVPIPVRSLRLGQERGQRARQRIDLVGGQDRAVDQARLLLGEQALESEQQREAPAPLDRGLLDPGIELSLRGIERASARRPGGEGLGGGLTFIYESLAREIFGTCDHGRTRKWGGSTHAILEG